MDRILTLNVGSSSLKWTLFDEGDARIDGATMPFDASRTEAAFLALAEIASRIGDVDAVAHRMVHGGDRFAAPAVVDRRVRRSLDETASLAPLHMRPALAVLDASRARWQGAVHVVAFDTSFHRTMPSEASTYAVPRVWRETYSVRRYGFHGLSVEYAISRVEPIAGRSLRRVIVLHLGSGSSATAVLDGRSVDTTMGMTPIEGIVMGTRSGSVDPGAILHLLRSGLPESEIEEGLVQSGGLVALSGRSDMRELARAAAEGDFRAQFARAHYVRSVAKHASSLLPSLGGLDALVFTGGIGENDAEVRDRIVRAMGFTGLALDGARNADVLQGDRVISMDSSAGIALVLRAREDIALVRAARQASCTQVEHAAPETHSGRDRLQ